MKKSSLIALALAGTLVLGGGGVFAAGQIARSNAISEENARNFAYVDAGVLPENAQYVSTKFDFSKGRFVYEIEFVAEGIKYEYTLDSATGAVIEKKQEAPVLQNESYRATEAASAQTLPVVQETTEAPREPIGLAAAKAAVLQSLGLQAEQVYFLEAALEREDGRLVYDIELKDEKGDLHEFELDAYTGEIRKESHKMADIGTYPAQTEPARPGESSAAASSEAATAASQAALIGVEKAKTIALADAGLGAEKVIFTKARQEREGTRLIYDIEFYESGRLKYEYEIDAYTGTILEKEWEPTEAMKAAQRESEEASRRAQAESKAVEEAARKSAEASSIAAAEASSRAAEASRQAAEIKAAQEAASRAEAERKAAEEAAHKASMEASKAVAEASRRAEEESRAREAAARESAAAESRAAAEEAARKAEAERKAAEEAARKAEAEKKAREEAAYKASVEASKAAEEARRASEEAARKASEEAARKAAEEAARKASEEAARKASEEAAHRASVEASKAAASSAASTQAQTISVEKAKEIALKDAGLSADQVQFEKAKLDREDGRLVYEIKFFIRGQKEYEYEIDAYTGQILDKDVENWDD